MRIRSLVTALPLLCLFVTPSFAIAEEWVYQYFSSHGGAVPINNAATWVNAQCKPDKMSDIKGFTSQQGGGGSDYNIHVFCRIGSGKAVVKGHTQTWGVGGGTEFAQTLEGRLLVILGFYDGVQADTVLLFSQVIYED